MKHNRYNLSFYVGLLQNTLQQNLLFPFLLRIFCKIPFSF